ncbi:unnamed protein product, partial [Ectocarpus sp. 12 AP-2014]
MPRRCRIASRYEHNEYETQRTGYTPQTFHMNLSTSTTDPGLLIVSSGREFCERHTVFEPRKPAYTAAMHFGRRWWYSLCHSGIRFFLVTPPPPTPPPAMGLPVLRRSDPTIITVGGSSP